jgi:hypothetical protein
MSADLKAVAKRKQSISQFVTALRATVVSAGGGGASAATDSEEGEEEGYGHPHYTERFDLLIAEALSTAGSSSGSAKAGVEDAALQNASAVIRFGALSSAQKQSWMQKTVDAFSDDAGGLHAEKQTELRALQLGRRAARSHQQQQQKQVASGEGDGGGGGGDDASFVPASSFRGVRPGYSYKTGEEGLGYYRDSSSSSSSSSTSASAGTGAGAGGADFGSVNDDMSVVNCLYRLAVGAVRSVLTALGFTEVRRGKSHVVSHFRTFVTKR